MGWLAYRRDRGEMDSWESIRRMSITSGMHMDVKHRGKTHPDIHP